MPHYLVGVAPIDMQQIDAIIGELSDGVVERAPQQAREASVTGIMEGGEIGEHLLGVGPGLRIAFPGIDRDALRRQPGPPHCLAERGIGDAAMRAQFDEHARLQSLDKPEGEGDMTIPSADHAGSGASCEEGVLRRIDQPIEDV